MTDRARCAPPVRLETGAAGGRGVRAAGRRSCCRATALALTLAIVAAPSLARAQSEMGSADRVGGYVFDALILRPASLAQLIIGSAVLVVAYPLTLPSGDQRIVLERCALDPFEDTFRRGLGDF